MNLTLILAVVALILIICLVVTVILIRKSRRRGLPNKFKEEWLQIQRLCASKDTWRQAVIGADKLLDKALKKSHIKGKTMGERLVAAQRKISDNDSVWFAHNLAKKLLANSRLVLREAEAKKALVGVRQALRDLGMLNGK